MKHRRHRYISPAKRRFRKRLLTIIVIAVVVLGIVLLLLPTVTGGRVALLPFQRDGGAGTPKPSKSPFRWPWQKESPSPTPTPTPLPGSSAPSPEDELLPSHQEQPAYVATATAPYPLQLDVNITEAARMQVVEQITYTNTSNNTQSELLLHFPAASLVDGSLSRLTYDGLANQADYQLDTQAGRLTLPLNQELLPGQTLRITFSYALQLPDGAGPLSYQQGEGTVIASDFYAYLASYDPQAAQWLPEQQRGLPLADITANITLPAGFVLGNSGSQTNRATLSTGSIRVLVEDISARRFGFATASDGLRNETITLDAGDFTVTNHAARSSTVVRVSELSNAILGHYNGYMGLPSADGDGINVLESALDQPTATWNNLILYNRDAFGDANEFRYQYALALARLYFSEGAGIDQNTEAFNTLLCHTLASAYVESSQSAEVAAAAYAHAPESSALNQIFQNMPDGAFGQALQQYRMDAVAGVFNLQSFYTALPGSSVPAVESLLLEYRQRTE